jgi:hypothetical protein
MTTDGEVIAALTEAEARTLTDAIKADAEALWRKCLEAYQRGAHTALGYASWGAYWEAEFGQSGRTGYRLLEAARVVEALPSDTHVTGQNVARALTPLRESTDQMLAAIQQAIDRHGDEPTADQVAEVVRTKTKPKPKPKPAKPKPAILTAAQKRVKANQQAHDMLAEIGSLLAEVDTTLAVWCDRNKGEPPTRAMADMARAYLQRMAEMTAILEAEIIERAGGA